MRQDLAALRKWGCVETCETCLDRSSTAAYLRQGKVHIHALRDIAAGEGLSYCLGIVLEEPYTPALRVLWACRCGSSACTETLLQPKAEANPAPAKKKGAFKRKKAAAK